MEKHKQINNILVEAREKLSDIFNENMKDSFETKWFKQLMQTIDTLS